MTLANTRRITLAQALAHDFERRHPNGKDTLLCVGLCRRRKDREDFRETPWHGRAASCMSCEGDTWRISQRERTYWELEQAREKLRTYQRHVQRLRLERLIRDIPKSADVIREWERPFVDAVERKRRQLTGVVLRTAVLNSEEGSHG